MLRRGDLVRITSDGRLLPMVGLFVENETMRDDRYIIDVIPDDGQMRRYSMPQSWVEPEPIVVALGLFVPGWPHAVR
jgi:hypothetical protein